YSLASSEYEKKLQERQLLRNPNHYRSNSILKSSNVSYITTTSIESSRDAQDESGATGSALKPEHIDLEFNDSKTNFYCLVYFAEEFRALRSEVLQVDDEEL